jgi:hypothetical protein
MFFKYLNEGASMLSMQTIEQLSNNETANTLILSNGIDCYPHAPAKFFELLTDAFEKNSSTQVVCLRQFYAKDALLLMAAMYYHKMKISELMLWDIAPETVFQVMYALPPFIKKVKLHELSELSLTMIAEFISKMINKPAILCYNSIPSVWLNTFKDLCVQVPPAADTQAPFSAEDWLTSEFGPVPSETMELRSRIDNLELQLKAVTKERDELRQQIKQSRAKSESRKEHHSRDEVAPNTLPNKIKKRRVIVTETTEVRSHSVSVSIAPAATIFAGKVKTAETGQPPQQKARVVRMVL